MATKMKQALSNNIIFIFSIVIMYITKLV